MRILFIALLVLSFNAFSSKAPRIVKMEVTEDGFMPDKVEVKKGEHLMLKITRKTDVTCATEIVIKDKNINTKLPLNKEITVDLGVLKEGKLTYSCGMDMISGVLTIN